MSSYTSKDGNREKEIGAPMFNVTGNVLAVNDAKHIIY